jgi:enoyl-CoA hydratase
MSAVLFTMPEPNMALITINREDRYNTLGAEVREGLFDAWRRFETDDALKVAILTGAGHKAFCAGGDLKEMASLALTVPPRDMFPFPGDNIEVTKPTIAAVNGIAYGGGFLLAQACDLVVASTAARFAISEAKVGRGAPWAVPLITKIPENIMMEMLLTGHPIDANRAYAIGFANRIAEPDALLESALDLARSITANAPLSVAAMKETVKLAGEMGRSAALRAARHAFDRAYRSLDAQEGPAAYAARREPRWQGR